MSDLDRELQREFAAEEVDPARQESMQQEVRKMFEQRMRFVAGVTWVSHVVLIGLLVLGMWMLQRPELSERTAGAFTAFVGGAALVAMKLWYWVLQAKYAVLTELKELQVQVAELAEQLPARD